MAFLAPSTLPLSSARPAALSALRPPVVRVVSSSPARSVRRSFTNMVTAPVEKGAGMRLIQAADEATIEKLGCRSWSTWGCPSSSFDWSYSDDEVCLVLAGDFTVTPDDGSEPMDVKAGDIAYFPRGMSCRWDVREAVNKHFTFGMKI